MNRKPVFDAVRVVLGREFSAAENGALTEALDVAEGGLRARDAARLIPASAAFGGRKLGAAGAALIKQFEGCEKDRPDGRFQSYPDPGSVDGNPWTIGWGSTGPDVTPTTIWTQQQCDARFDLDMQKYANVVAKALGEAPTTQNQFDALVSFHYNTGAIRTATLTKKHLAGKFVDAQAEFAKWVKNDGKVMNGLVRRRAAEAALYSKP
jgi:GH24 family phage-related lysozyme (muramidase)